MVKDLEMSRTRTPVVRRLAAGLILIAAAALAVWAIIGIVKTILWIAVVVVAIGGVIWALKTLVW